jgi:hypothetical protein
MPDSPPSPDDRSAVTDLQGAARLATDATRGLTDLVEAMHERIARLPGVPAPEKAGRTSGLTGLIYKTIRGVTRVAGGSVDALLGLVGTALERGAAEPGPQREAIVAALNGVLGDHLAASGNPLATPMSWRRDGRPWTPADADGGDILILAHGLCMNDLQWRRDGHDHGTALVREFGFSPVYLRYNSGLHIATNGRTLADRLEALIGGWPHPVRRVAMLTHSMGGLLARSALHFGLQAGHRWPHVLDELIFLGTPHHGAPLERAGQGLTLLLGATPYTAPFARLARLRSAGITDLRHANLIDEGLSTSSARPPTPVPLPALPRLRCFTVAARLGVADGVLSSKVLGDGLVPLDSALGRHPDPSRTLHFAPERQWVADGVNHLALLSRPEVAERLRGWLTRTNGRMAG